MDTDPTAYPRRVLLAVAGLSPQVVTETIYGLAVARQPPFLPTEVALITSSEGAKRARLSLLSDDPGWFRRLCRDYGLPPMRFDPSNITVIQDAAGHALADIRDPDDNARVADQITDTIRALTADPNCALHVSIAGGRKTLGYYAGYALSLFGRVQDRLSHVLVSAPFESSWDFFYPTPYARVIATRDNNLADTADARVTLAEIPFVRLREGLPERLLRGETSFSDSIAAAQRALQPPELVVDLPGQRIRAAGETLTLPPAALAFYATLARRRSQERHGARWDTEDIHQDYLKEYRSIVGDFSGELERAEAALASGMTPEYFDQRKSRTNSALSDALGDQLAAPYLIRPEGARPRTRFGLGIAPDAIRFDTIGSDTLEQTGPTPPTDPA